MFPVRSRLEVHLRAGGIIKRDRGSGRRSHPDRIDEHPFFRRLAGGLERVPSVFSPSVITTTTLVEGSSNENDSNARVMAAADRRTGRRDRIDVNHIEEEVRRRVIGGERELREGVSCKDDETDPVAPQALDQIPEFEFCFFSCSDGCPRPSWLSDTSSATKRSTPSCFTSSSRVPTCGLASPTTSMARAAAARANFTHRFARSLPPSAGRRYPGFRTGEALYSGSGARG